MNFAHLHLVLTQFPPVLSLGGAVSAAVGVLRRRRDLVRLMLVLLLAVGAMMPAVFVAGERTAESIGKVRGVQQDAIAPHERAATIALSLSIGAALVAAGMLLIERRRGDLTQAFRVLVLIAAIAAMLGLAIPPAIGMRIASGLLVAVWLAILFSATGTKPAVRAVAFAAAALSFVAIGFHVRLLLWIGVLTMAVAGFAPLTRSRSAGPPSPRWHGARDLTI